MGRALDLGRARSAAAGAFEAERVRLEGKHGQAVRRDRQRKRVATSGPDGLLPELRAQWEWLVAAGDTFSRLDFDTQRAVLLTWNKHPRGVDGYAPHRAAGNVLLDWFAASGRDVTATKFGGGAAGDDAPGGNAYMPSHAVEFLAVHLAEIDSALEERDETDPARDLALDVAYTVTRAWLQERQSGGFPESY